MSRSNKLESSTWSQWSSEATYVSAINYQYLIPAHLNSHFSYLPQTMRFILGSPYSPYPPDFHIFGPSQVLQVPTGPPSAGSLRHLPVAHRSSTRAPGGGATALQRQGRGGSSGLGRPKWQPCWSSNVSKIWGLNHVEKFHRWSEDGSKLKYIHVVVLYHLDKRFY